MKVKRILYQAKLIHKLIARHPQFRLARLEILTLIYTAAVISPCGFELFGFGLSNQHGFDLLVLFIQLPAGASNARLLTTF